MELTNAQKMRDADNTAIHVYGVPSTWLMTNAAAHVARAALEQMDVNRRAVIFCGSGNNGGDGVAAALYLLRRGVRVRVLLVGSREKLSHDTAEMSRRLTELGGVLEDFDPEEPGLAGELKETGVIIDAMFGVGLNKPLRGKALQAVELINGAGVPVVSADIASGVEADTGRILGAAVKAAVTVTFSLAKPGHFVEPGCTCCGQLLVEDIGIPRELVDGARTGYRALEEAEARLPRRPAVSHKGDYGKLLIIGGSVGYTGAPTLCAAGAVRAGAGLVHLGVPGTIYAITAIKNNEAMPFPLPDRDGKLTMKALPRILEKLSACDLCAVGMGLGRSEELTELVQALTEQSEKPLLIDADGLFALAQDMTVLNRAKAPVILTPHEGEFVRMGGMLTGDRMGDARRFAEKHGCILVLKGHHSLCAFPDGTVVVIPYGNPGMAKGGTGDVLAGVIAALAGQLPLEEAVPLAVYIHARAGDLCAERLGQWSMTPTDLTEALPEVTRRMEKGE